MKSISDLSPNNIFDCFVLALRILDLQKEIGAKGGSSAFDILDCPLGTSCGGWDAQKIEKTVYDAMRIGGLTGRLNTCLSRSVIRCRLMREAGIDARVIFGLNKNEDMLKGHCWVVWEGSSGPGLKDSNFDFIEVYPSIEKHPGWFPE